MANKEELYKRIKIAGMISYIPIMLATAPFAGLFLGEYLQKRFHLPFFVLAICVGIGIAVGIREAIRIIKMVLAIENKDKNA